MRLLQAVVGFFLFLASVLWGWSSNLYIAFVTMVTGYWLIFDSLNKAFFKESLLTKFKPRHFIKIVFLGALLGIVLDFDMTLTKVIEYYTMNNLWNIFLLYLGWGVSLPAMYEGYCFFSRWLSKIFGKIGFEFLPKRIEVFVLESSGLIGALLILFVFLFFIHSSVPGFFIVFLFLGNWLVLEYIQHKKAESGLLETILRGNFIPVFGIAISAVLFCIAWESMNLPMGHWAYVNLFWLESKILGIPLVAFFGYFCWFAIYLSFYKLFLDKKD